MTERLQVARLCRLGSEESVAGLGSGLAGGREREERKSGRRRGRRGPASPRLTLGIKVFCEKEEKKLGFSFGGWAL